MLGQIIYTTERRWRVRPEYTRIMGLGVLQMALNPEGRRAGRRLERAGRVLHRAGVRRVLVPEEFKDWAVLEGCSLQRMDPGPFLRAQAANLILAALCCRGVKPERSAVALRALRADRDVVNAARALCPRVRDVCICVPRGGEELCDGLRREYGAAVRPDYPGVEGAVRFAPGTREEGGIVLDLFGPDPRLCGVTITAAGVESGGIQQLGLLAALWEAGKVEKRDLEFT